MRVWRLFARLLALLLAVVPTVLLAPGIAGAHALHPGYLELRALGGDTWQVLWRKPDVEGQPMAIEPVIGPPCEAAAVPSPRFDGEGFVARWTVACPGGLVGAEIAIDGLSRTSTDVLVRYELSPGEGEVWRLVPGAPAFVVPEAPGALAVAKSYTVLGVEHILFGVDHLLFVLALLLLIRGFGPLLLTITAFTVAHSITLGAAALGLANVPGPPVEAVIALSIMFVAAEVVQRDPAAPRLSERVPWVIAFVFGLIHGFGFGSALAEIGLPKGEVVLALLAFNVGVELGQLAFVAVVAALWWAAGRWMAGPAALRLRAVAAYAIGSVAAFWFVERLAGF